MAPVVDQHASTAPLSTDHSLANYSGLFFVVDASLLASSKDGGATEQASLQKALSATSVGAVPGSPLKPIVLLVLNCEDEVKAEGIRQQLCRGTLKNVSVHVVSAADDGRAEIYDALDILSAQLNG
eukprot:gnl/TRDRNA2_/TRDRNA2_101283_c0_seq1.p1 gnl/TRDRNA2_/TRDRNA2_101283_c0~~gnl/TRDRNA2_/TRDRNA2_101283_c0_seq1.p1  ORF type:complete len:140 (-),score=25.15 gnl/TRDRNA2_/TRDRNA2_101283_c0_seq1:263-640(-)